MAHIGLVACVAKKTKMAAPAQDLYISPLFIKSKRFVELTCDNWFVLSAKHGLVLPQTMLEPYEETLQKKAVSQCQIWANKVLRQLHPFLKKEDTITILAGNCYRKYLEAELGKIVSVVHVPLRGLRIGEQLRWLTQKVLR